MICPKCDGNIDALIKKKWGDGVQRQRYAPFVCSHCGSLMLLDLKTDALITPEEAKELVGLDPIPALRSNKALWEVIEAHRNLILSYPNRRPVLR